MAGSKSWKGSELGVALLISCVKAQGKGNPKREPKTINMMGAAGEVGRARP